MIIGLIALAAILRFPGLSTPATIVFDEAYYARDACLYTGISQEDCNAPQATEQSYVHPPLGKWLIAIGVKLFGYKAFGWRVMAAVFGTAMVPIAYLLMRKLFRDRWAAGMAGFLVALDFLLIAQSRIGMLDIFVAFFILLGFLFLAFDWDRLKLLRENALLPFPGDRPAREVEWRFAAGAAFGLALAVKWSAGFALAGGLIMALFWSASTISTEDQDQGWKKRSRRFGREAATSALALVLVPLLVYVMSYSLWFKDNYGERHCTTGSSPVCASGPFGIVIAFEQLQTRMWQYHRDLRAGHTYQAQAWTWPLVARPIAYYYVGPPDAEKIQHILAFANPVVWWPALASAVWLAIAGLRRWRPERFVMAAWGWQYLPWLATSIISAIWAAATDPVRPLFFFYMTPIAPFMMMSLAASLSALRSVSRPFRWLVRVWLVIGVVGLFIYFLPIIYGTGLSQPAWDGRMWFRAGCSDKPAGWCWI